MKFRLGDAGAVDPLTARGDDHGGLPENFLEPLTTSSRMLIKLNRQHRSLRDVDLLCALGVLEHGDRRSEHDAVGSRSGAACIILGSVDEKPQAALETNRRDAERLRLLVVVRERTQRDETIERAVAERGLDENFQLIAIRLQLRLRHSHAACSSSNAFGRNSSSALITAALKASLTALLSNDKSRA